VTLLKWKLVSVCLKIVLISAQARCTVCGECTIGSEIGANPRVLLSDIAQVEARFGLFGDSVNLDARLVHGLR
jgi:hypothetical protein